ncbi:Forkhead box protein N4, partial [Ophiophagus hannah]
LLGSDPSHLSEDDFPGDLQSLSWLTSVDVPRLQQMTSERMDFGLASQNVVLQQTGAIHTSGPARAIQASVSPNILGLNTISPHESNISQYLVGGQPSPSLQPQLSPLFPPPSCHTQQIFTITHSTQQSQLQTGQVDPPPAPATRGKTPPCPFSLEETKIMCGDSQAPCRWLPWWGDVLRCSKQRLQGGVTSH